MGRPRIDLLGRRFGRLVVIERAPDQRDCRGHTVSYWLCECICGSRKTVRHSFLQSGYTDHCGCARRAPVRVLHKWYDRKLGVG
jgi:hypothetical protein